MASHTYLQLQWCSLCPGSPRAPRLPQLPSVDLVDDGRDGVVLHTHDVNYALSVLFHSTTQHGEEVLRLEAYDVMVNFECLWLTVDGQVSAWIPHQIDLVMWHENIKNSELLVLQSPQDSGIFTPDLFIPVNRPSWNQELDVLCLPTSTAMGARGKLLQLRFILTRSMK